MIITYIIGGGGRLQTLAATSNDVLKADVVNLYSITPRENARRMSECLKEITQSSDEVIKRQKRRIMP